LNSFVGRAFERRHVLELLTSTRLLTLTGAGGVGKTRLALAVLRELRTDRQTTGSFVDLASLADPDLVPQTVAARLGVPEQPGRPVVATLVDALRGETALLVLDNCEHLVQACASLAHELLTACPGLRVLATSREPLLIAGEKVGPAVHRASPGG
jgi:predicted ATPase